MKKSILVLTATIAMVMFGCKESPYIPNPGTTDQVPDSMPVIIPDTNGIEISVDSAIAICRSLPADVATSEIYKLTGELTVNSTNPDDVPTKYKNINFKLSDNGGQSEISCYYINNINNKRFSKTTDVPLVGSKLTVRGQLINYKGTTPELKDGFIVRIDSMVAPAPFPGCPDPKEGEISVNRAIAISDSIGAGNTTTESYKIRCVVTSVSDLSTQYGNATFNVSSDGKKSATCYRLKGKNNSNFTNANQLLVGDTILVNAKIQNYKGTCEPVQGYVEESTNPNF